MTPADSIVEEHTGPSLNWIRTGPPDAPTVLFLHAVGYDLTYWDRQIEALSGSYNVVAVDLPGHGRSAGEPSDWTFPKAAAIIARFIESLGTGTVHLVGISFGSMVAQALVLARPDLIRSLTLIGSATTFAEPARDAIRARAEAVRAGGMAAILASSLDRWFTPATRLDRPHLIDRVSKTILTDNPSIHAAIWDLVATLDFSDRLHEITCPTLILVGELDSSTPPAAAALLAERIAGATLLHLPNTSHLATLEQPELVNTHLKHFLGEIEQRLV